MKARKPQRKPSLSPKTAWTAIWFAVLGLSAFHLYGLVRPAAPPLAELLPAGPFPAPVLPFRAERDDESRALEMGDSPVSSPSEPLHLFSQSRGDELCAFYRALGGLGDKNDGTQPVRVLHVGDSLSTKDEISGQVRRRLQVRFGDGGHGFILMGKPWRWYRHQDVLHGARGQWRSRPVTSDPVGDGLYGLGGVGLESETRGATAWAGPVPEGPVGTTVRRFDISYLKQPLGGSFDLVVDGVTVDTVMTRATSKSIAHRVLEVEPDHGRLTLRVRGDGRLRVFGAALESGEPGVVYDTVAINGARAQALNLINPQAWSDEVARREPSLLVVMLGANEGNGDRIGAAYYKQELGRLISTLKSGSQNSSCLVVGPLDQLERDGSGRLQPRPTPSKIGDVQRQVAVESGCAFFDTLTAMGGPGSLASWLKRGLGGADLVHPTDEGARLVGGWIADALMYGYDEYMKDEEKCASSVTSL